MKPGAAGASRAPMSGLRKLCVAFGIVLFGYAFIPVPQGDATAFVWEGGMDADRFMAQIYPGAMGLFLLVLGFAPMPTALLGLATAAVGAVPVLYVIARGQRLEGLVGTANAFLLPALPDAVPAAMGADLEWRAKTLGAAVVALPFALFLRGRRWDSVVARLLVAAGVAAILAVYVVPLKGLLGRSGAGRLPLAVLWETAGAGGGAALALGVFLSVPAALGFLSCAAFAPSGRSGLANVFGALFLLWVPAAVLAAVVYLSAYEHDALLVVQAGRYLVYAAACQLFAVLGLVSVLPARQGSHPAAAPASG